MKEILTEWRNYLVKENLTLVPKISSVATSTGSFVDLLSANAGKELGPLEKAADKLKSSWCK